MKKDIKQALRQLVKADGNEALFVSARLSEMAEEARVKAEFFEDLAHLMYSKAVGCPTHEGECRFHRHRFDKMPTRDWKTKLAQ